VCTFPGVNQKTCLYITRLAPTSQAARVAQWIARWTSNPEVVGSSPISGYTEDLCILYTSSTRRIFLQCLCSTVACCTINCLRMTAFCCWRAKYNEVNTGIRTQVYRFKVCCADHLHHIDMRSDTRMTTRHNRL
jgi:hypothetical protein